MATYDADDDYVGAASVSAAAAASAPARPTSLTLRRAPRAQRHQCAPQAQTATSDGVTDVRVCRMTAADS